MDGLHFFFKTIGKRQRPDNDGYREPSALTILLCNAFRECIKNNTLLDSMTTAIVSLIYKNKGKRYDISKYRPIAVASILYRILSKTVVV